MIATAKEASVSWRLDSESNIEGGGAGGGGGGGRDHHIASNQLIGWSHS